ncbi:RNA polymerase sigma factor [Halalkalibacter urbisdiaboli]|uniref:RNA polymerase sigma factor n=1 Tax=Halalkalibacter urbisdiaboli TaxID=1960589 RepID=UPI001A98098C|nr:sigma-70 family RNA polymerase sigma factor [Halalkalibacter urbisdiaboli]
MIHKSEGETWLREIEDGSAIAFEQFYDQYSSFVFGIALNILKNKNDAEDLCHDVFLEIYKNPSSYNRERGSVEAWIAVKTKSRCLDRLKRKKIAYGTDNDLADISDSSNVEEKVLANVDRELVMGALQRLPELQRKVIYGNYFLGQSHRKLSEQLNRPLGTIKSLVRYGMNNMKHYFNTKARGEKNDM